MKKDIVTLYPTLGGDKITLENIERISEDVAEFMQTVKKYPSWVLFGEPPPHFGHEFEKKEEDKN